MSNTHVYNSAFINTFEITQKGLDKLKYNEIDEWDSIGHMNLIADLEEKFNITFETDDIVDFSSYVKGKEILKRYKINL